MKSLDNLTGTIELVQLDINELNNINGGLVFPWGPYALIVGAYVLTYEAGKATGEAIYQLTH
jgi:bacteriocin-like protein